MLPRTHRIVTMAREQSANSENRNYALTESLTSNSHLLPGEKNKSDVGNVLGSHNKDLQIIIDQESLAIPGCSNFFNDVQEMDEKKHDNSRTISFIDLQNLNTTGEDSDVILGSVSLPSMDMITSESEMVLELHPTDDLEPVSIESVRVLATGSEINDVISIQNDSDKKIILARLPKTNDDVDDPDYIATSDSGGSSSEEREGQELPEEETENRKGKKRKRNPQMWKKNIRINKRAAGEEYISVGNKLIKKREMKAPCDDCRMKCTQRITDDARKIIHSQFWSSQMKTNQKRQFICSAIEETPIERARVRTGRRTGKRQTSLRYFFTVSGRRIPVCRTFFLTTLSVSQTTIRFALAKRQTSGVVTPDQRGKHEPSNKIGQEIRNLIREHIKRFPCIESHYSRNKSAKKYLGSHLNITRMYQLFCEECLNSHMPEEEIPKDWIYRDIFNSEFNLSFKEPGNDTCDACDEYKMKLKGVNSDVERNEIQNEYDAHLLDADNRYKLKRQDKEACDVNSAKVLMVDLQKCLPTPLLKNAQSFYSLKLWTFNFTVYDSSTKSSSCYVWDESQAGRGGNEIGSCLRKYILSLNCEVKKIIIWSDNCPSQNRNIQIIMCYLSTMMVKPSLECIEHKFLLRGHTHMEVDTIHARIEKQMKATPQFSIVTPWDWQQVMRLCGPKIMVEGMEILDFKNLNNLYDNSDSPYQNIKKTEQGQNFLISKVVHMKFLKEDPGVLHFKTSFEQEHFQRIDFNKNFSKRTSRRLQNSNSINEFELTPLRNAPKPISTKKYNDLQKLLKWVPRQFHSFFQGLQHANLKEDD